MEELDRAGPPSERTRIRRLPRRAAYDRATIHAILDEGLVCHLAFAGQGGQPFAIPTAYARIGEHVYVHGSSASRTLRTSAGAPVCLTVTLIDGLVLARSAFHHSMNYRSVVVLGAAEEVTGDEERLAAMRALVERIAPGRWAEIRAPSPQELKATTILRLSLAEASAKIRTGPPIDDDEDLALPCWAGVVPLALRADAPIPDAGVTAESPVTAIATRR